MSLTLHPGEGPPPVVGFIIQCVEGCAAHGLLLLAASENCFLQVVAAGEVTAVFFVHTFLLQHPQLTFPSAGDLSHHCVCVLLAPATTCLCCRIEL